MWIYVAHSLCILKNLIWLFWANNHWINKPLRIKNQLRHKCSSQELTFLCILQPSNVSFNHLIVILFVSSIWNHSNTPSARLRSKERWSGSVPWNLWKAPQRWQTKTSSQKATSVGERQRDAVGRDGLRGSMWGGFRNVSPQFARLYNISFGINNCQIQGDQTSKFENWMNLK